RRPRLPDRRAVRARDDRRSGEPQPDAAAGRRAVARLALGAAQGDRLQARSASARPPGGGNAGRAGDCITSVGYYLILTPAPAGSHTFWFAVGRDWEDVGDEADVVSLDALYRAAGRLPRPASFGLGRHPLEPVQARARPSHVQRLHGRARIRRRV